MDLSEHMAEPKLNHWFFEDSSNNGYTLFVEPATEVVYKKIITIPYCVNLLATHSKHNKLPTSFHTCKRINSIPA